MASDKVLNHVTLITNSGEIIGVGICTAGSFHALKVDDSILHEALSSPFQSCQFKECSLVMLIYLRVATYPSRNSRLRLFSPGHILKKNKTF